MISFDVLKLNEYFNYGAICLYIQLMINKNRKKIAKYSFNQIHQRKEQIFLIILSKEYNDTIQRILK